MSLWRRSVAPLAFVFSGCVGGDVDGLAERWLTPAEQEYAPTFIGLVQTSDFEAARRYVSADVTREFTDQLWSTLAERLRGVSLDSLRLVGLNVNVNGNVRTVQQVFEVPVAEEWLLIDLATRASQVYRFVLRADTISLAERNAFSNASFGTSHLVVLLWGISAFAAALIAAARTLRSRMRHRWLWAPLCFVIVGRVGLDWTTGATGTQLLHVAFPPLGGTKAGPDAPWVFITGVPLFAMIALRRARRWELEPEPEPDPPDSNDVGTWSVMRSTPDGGETCVATHLSRKLAEAQAEQLRSAGLGHRYWVQGAE